MYELWVVYLVGTIASLVGASLGMILMACCASRGRDEECERCRHRTF